jgi:hypothetical protein
VSHFPRSIPSPSSGTISIGPLSIHAYGLMIAFGVVAGVMLAGRRLEARRAGTRDDDLDGDGHTSSATGGDDCNDANWNINPEAIEVCDGADALVVLTEWDEFKDLNFEKIHDEMLKPAFLFDGRNVLPHDKLRAMGFRVFAIGKPF